MLVELISRNAGDAQEYRPYYPSPSKVGKCVRALTYHALGVKPDPFPDRAMLVFDDGNWHEELIKDHIRKTVYQLTEWKGKNQRFFIADINGQAMEGEIDGLLTDPLGDMILLEIKSINHFGFQRLSDRPLAEHRRQANLYLHGLILSGLSIKKALILYKNKNTAAMKEYLIDYDEVQALADIDMFRQIDEWAKAKTIPPRQYDQDDWHCEYCTFQTTCWKNYMEEFMALSDDVALSEELETTARYYKELGAQESAIKKEREELKNILKKALKDASAKSGRIGNYLIRLVVSQKTEIDMSLVPQEAITKKITERLDCRAIKKPEKREG